MNDDWPSEWYDDQIAFHANEYKESKQKAEPLKKISEIDDADSECPYCLGTGWVCENHTDRPWLDGVGCHCGGAGMPCTCNPLSKRG